MLRNRIVKAHKRATCRAELYAEVGRRVGRRRDVLESGVPALHWIAAGVVPLVVLLQLSPHARGSALFYTPAAAGALALLAAVVAFVRKSSQSAWLAIAWLVVGTVDSFLALQHCGPISGGVQLCGSSHNLSWTAAGLSAGVALLVAEMLGRAWSSHPDVAGAEPGDDLAA